MLEDRIRRAVADLEPELTTFLQRLVRIPSVPGAEAEAHACAANEMRGLALDVTVLKTVRAEIESHPAFSDDGLSIEERPNVVGVWRGADSAGGRSLILNGHLDVVSAGDEGRWTRSPWSGVIAGRRVYGRGACDMKGGVAAAIYAVAALQRLGTRPRGDVLIETVSGEESGGVGTLATIVKGYRADAAVILEPTALRLCPVQAGALTFRLTVTGSAAHGALRESGVSAEQKLRPLLDVIDALERERHRDRWHPLFRSNRLIAPISIGVVRAGDWPSTVPESAMAEGRFGVFPGEGLTYARREFESAIETASRRDVWLSTHPPRIEWTEGQFEAGETPADAPIVEVLAAAHHTLTGSDVVLEGVPYGSDLRLFTNHAHIPAVLYGPGHIEQAHAVDEFVDIDEALSATAVIALSIIEWCGT